MLEQILIALLIVLLGIGTGVGIDETTRHRKEKKDGVQKRTEKVFSAGSQETDTSVRR